MSTFDAVIVAFDWDDAVVVLHVYFHIICYGIDFK
jgi:hypothetical protein